ncbi:hypothetical protein [Maledivibacter halophilus]|uniref:Uncharacterized protein n=1 Tax=Maledivibacter halophilus TaxID=36842 RepID=A0A1T5L7V8_9FIRM|nr:hypothetical protein [Maledivibacter halophilus]SKC72024.1 hypothetical protein SAMN02194393_02551 [Maledivibacter halophilus]
MKSLIPVLLFLALFVSMSLVFFELLGILGMLILLGITIIMCTGWIVSTIINCCSKNEK